MPKLAATIKYYGILTVSYLLLAVLLPNSKTAQANFHLSSSGYHALLLLIVLPLIGIWFGAFYSYARLKQYSYAVAGSPEGADFAQLTRGFTWLAWGSILSAMLSLVLNSLADAHPSLMPASVIAVNYASLIVWLVGFYIISGSSRNLNARANIVIKNSGAKLLMIGFIVLSVMYCFVTFKNLDLQSLNSTDNPFYLPVWLVLLSIVVPYLYTWFIGLLSAYEISLYSKRVQGVLYQRAMRLLSLGVVSVIASSIVVSYFRSAAPRAGHLSLGTTILIINVIYIFIAAGYVLISLGARQLRKIEEV